MRKMKIVAVLAASMLGLSVAGVAVAAKPLEGGGTLCGSGQRAIVHNPGQANFFVRNAYWKGKGNACVQTNGNASFKLIKAPTPSTDVVAFPDLTRGCHWGECTPNTDIPVRVSHIRMLRSYVVTAHRPWGSWDKAYDLWFGTRRISDTSHPDAAELMVWNDEHGACCGLASDATKVFISGKWWWRTYWTMHDRSVDQQYGGVHWQYIQYRLVHSRPSMHVNLKAFINDAERMNLIRQRWWLECVEYGFEIWSGGVPKQNLGRGLQVTHYELHFKPTR